MKAELDIKNEAEMLALGETLSHICGTTPVVIFLHGELGAGKTTLTRGFLRGCGYQGVVKSPTYTMVEPYELDDKKIYHFDLYRLTDPEELDFIGIRDYFVGDAISLVEWPERGGSMLPKPDLTCNIAIHGEARLVQLESISSAGRHLLEQLKKAIKTL